VYNPQIQNMLSQVGAQGLGGPSIANPDGPGAAGPSGQGGGPSWQKTKNDFQQAWDVSEGYPSATYSDGEGASVALPLGAVAFGIDFLVNFFEDLFSGPNSPPIPRKLMHKRHPLYGEILGIQDGLVPTEGSAAPKAGGQAVPMRSPDFYTLEVNAGYVAGVSVDVSIDRYGHGYIAPGVEIGKSPTFLSASVTAGYLNQSTTPPPAELHNFLTSNSFNVGGGNYLGGGEAYTPGVGFATQFGLFTPQAGAAYHYGFALP
jgi:hypothetical protein